MLANNITLMSFNALAVLATATPSTGDAATAEVSTTSAVSSHIISLDIPANLSCAFFHHGRCVKWVTPSSTNAEKTSLMEPRTVTTTSTTTTPPSESAIREKITSICLRYEHTRYGDWNECLEWAPNPTWAHPKHVRAEQSTMATVPAPTSPLPTASVEMRPECVAVVRNTCALYVTRATTLPVTEMTAASAPSTLATITTIRPSLTRPTETKHTLNLSLTLLHMDSDE